MNVELPTYIPLAEATERYRLGSKALTQLVEDGRIRAARVNGGVVVAEEDVGVATMQAEVRIDESLRGQPIRVTEAAEKYGVDQKTLSRWAYADYVQIIERGPKLLVLDEADVKLSVEIFKQAMRSTGSFVRAGWILKRTLEHRRS